MPSLFTFLNLLRAYEHLKVGFGLTPVHSTGQDLLGGGTILLPEIVTVYWPLAVAKRTFRRIESAAADFDVN